MRKIACVLFVMAVASSAFAEDVGVDANVKLNDRLAPIEFALGTWLCNGQYNTVPPFTVAHPDVAIVTFASDVGGQWIVGSYREFTTQDNPAPVSIKDSISIDPFTGVGLRVLFDSNTGGMLGNFVQTGRRLDFTGTYVLAGQGVPFTETVIYSDDGRTFTSDSRVFGLTFHVQTCNRLF